MRRDAGVGAGVDSFHEYLLKAYLALGDPSYLDTFAAAYAAATARMQLSPALNGAAWLVDVHMSSGRVLHPYVSALGAFWPGLQALAGQAGEAAAGLAGWAAAWARFGWTPEMFHWRLDHPQRPPPPPHPLPRTAPLPPAPPAPLRPPGRGPFPTACPPQRAPRPRTGRRRRTPAATPPFASRAGWCRRMVSHEMWSRPAFIQMGIRGFRFKNDLGRFFLAAAPERYDKSRQMFYWRQDLNLPHIAHTSKRFTN